ncbi:hypothetical protein [Buttiauxella gaviniae]|uniref:hypothetical protein n=1 Tax=Buttiauxella gaviniae TaxID=82990 RepID=UPI0039B0FFFD
MSNAANWSYTAQATVWKTLGYSESGDNLGYSAPIQILCDYEGGLSKRIGSIGAEIVVKNTIWTEFTGAASGDYILIGTSTDADPLNAGADEVRQVIRYADTFERIAEDIAIITGV